MNITVIYSTGRKGSSSTYQIAQMLIKELLEDGTCFEFQLPKDMPHICTGCYACIHGQEQKCGGATAMAPILTAMEESQLILFCAPTYVFHIPGQMKTLLDHFAYRWMVHRPDLSFLKKQAVIINTAGGGGMRSTLRDIKDSTENWGIARTYCLSQSVWNYTWKELPVSFQNSIQIKVKRTARKVRHHAKHLTPSCKVRCLFMLYRFLHKHQKMSAVDDAYWQKKRYTTGTPWKANL
ncbi:flavodoxin family protein [Brotaphodocola sp.]|uniref:flavodoxin family protein n=1 Tax=Brotaphodocola sp. TaxID=3073577 RepID=UPI003D7EE7A4